MAWEENSRICLHMQLIAILSRTVVNIDPVSETALSCCIKSLFMLKHENAAIGTYQRFVAEYKKHTGEDYPTPFSLYWN